MLSKLSSLFPLVLEQGRCSSILQHTHQPGNKRKHSTLPLSSSCISSLNHSRITSFLPATIKAVSISTVAPSRTITSPLPGTTVVTKTSILTDTHKRVHTYLRISLTERCNLRCMYCMPEEGVDLQPTSNIMSREEIVRLAKFFVENGVNKIRLTGGEPLVRKDIEEIVVELGKLKPLGLHTLAITTNGINLQRKLPALFNAGVNLLNISLDTLVPDKFTLLTRRLGWEKVINSINLAVEYGYDPVKVNCVVMRGINDDELVDFVEMTRTKPIQVRFIEYMPFGGNNWKDTKFVPYSEMITSIQKKFPNFDKAMELDGPNETSRSYQVPGFRGKIGFITSMSEHFCGSCNRLRITADGNLKVCLFGKEEVSLRDAMRNGATDAQLGTIINSALLHKKPSHAGMYEIAQSENRPMILIGG